MLPVVTPITFCAQISHFFIEISGNMAMSRLNPPFQGGSNGILHTFFQSGTVFFFRLSAVFWSALGALMCTFLECFFHQKHPKNFPRAPRALFWSKFREKHPSAAFGPTIRKTKNFPSCFFSSCLLVAARSAAKFSFSPGIFLLKRSQNEDRVL